MNDLKIEITKDSVVSRKTGSFTNDDGQLVEYDSFSQPAWFHNGKAYPVEIQLRFADKPDDTKPRSGMPIAYAPGFYAIGQGSFVARNGRLAFNQVLELIPLVESAGKQKA